MAPLTKDAIRQLLLTNDRAVLRAVVVLHKRQTASEKSQKATLCENGRGFNSADGAPMSRYADRINRGAQLGPRDLKDARRRSLKYTGQLLEIALEKQARLQLQQLSADASAAPINSESQESLQCHDPLDHKHMGRSTSNSSLPPTQPQRAPAPGSAQWLKAPRTPTPSSAKSTPTSPRYAKLGTGQNSLPRPTDSASESLEPPWNSF